MQRRAFLHAATAATALPLLAASAVAGTPPAKRALRKG